MLPGLTIQAQALEVTYREKETGLPPVSCPLTSICVLQPSAHTLSPTPSLSLQIEHILKLSVISVLPFSPSGMAWAHDHKATAFYLHLLVLTEYHLIPLPNPG